MSGLKFVLSYFLKFTRKTPLLVSGVGQFSNANNFLFESLIVKYKIAYKKGLNEVLITPMVLLKVGQMQSYLHFKINLPPVLKAGSSGK